MDRGFRKTDVRGEEIPSPGVRFLQIASDERDAPVEADGGVTLENVGSVLEAGANVIVAGSAVFSGDVAGNARKFLELMQG